MVKNVKGVKPQFNFDVFIVRYADGFVQRSVKSRKRRAPARVTLQVAVWKFEINNITSYGIDRPV